MSKLPDIVRDDVENKLRTTVHGEGVVLFQIPKVHKCDLPDSGAIPQGTVWQCQNCHKYWFRKMISGANHHNWECFKEISQRQAKKKINKVLGMIVAKEADDVRIASEKIFNKEMAFEKMELAKLALAPAPPPPKEAVADYTADDAIIEDTPRSRKYRQMAYTDPIDT